MEQQQQELVVEFWEDKTAVIRFNNFKLVIEELKTYFKDFKLGIQRVFEYKKVQVYKNISFEWNHKFDKLGTSGGSVFNCCWGSVNNKGKYSNKPNRFTFYPKSGIEILEKVDDDRMLGKGLTIKELKQQCKINGLKKYSKLDKLKLINLLMSI